MTWRIGNVGCGLDDVLNIIQDQEDLLIVQKGVELVRERDIAGLQHTECSGDGGEDAMRVAYGR